jgi:hypothetical protein
MALAKAESGGVLFNAPVVVLADRDKAEMDEEVRLISTAWSAAWSALTPRTLLPSPSLDCWRYSCA